MNESLSIISLITEAGFVVQIIIIILVIMSIYSWTIIFSRKSEIIKVNCQIKEFYKIFDISKGLANCYNHNSNNFISNILDDGLKEFYNTKNDNKVERAYRKMNLSLNSATSKIENRLSILAMIASSSPYIGLFGTVWGIMHSFLGLASVKQATIAIVAPGIAEALIATAFGLFAAIPATIFYNRLISNIENIYAKSQLTIEEAIILMQK